MLSLLGGALLAASACAAPTNLLFAVRAGGDTNGVPRIVIRKTQEAIRPLFQKMGTPKPGDWLAEHAEEGQTFERYILSRPPRPVGARKILYVQPIGEFPAGQMAIVSNTAVFLSLYFNLDTAVLTTLPRSIIPASARRVHSTWGDQQVLSGYVLDSVLKPNLPADAAALIAFTSFDLWPGKGWNFVFGQASLADRVGVWSIYRNGKTDGTPEEFRQCLLRTMQTASHETGHMFGMEHCIAYECNMCGCNSREEADRRPIALCPQCAAKVWWATGADPLARYEKLGLFCEQQGLKPQAELYQRLAARCK